MHEFDIKIFLVCYFRYSLLLSYETEEDLRERTDSDNREEPDTQGRCPDGQIRSQSGCQPEAPSEIEYRKPSVENDNSQCMPSKVYVVVGRRRVMRKLRGTGSKHYDVAYENRTHLVFHLPNESYENFTRVLDGTGFEFEVIKVITLEPGL